MNTDESPETWRVAIPERGNENGSLFGDSVDKPTFAANEPSRLGRLVRAMIVPLLVLAGTVALFVNSSHWIRDNTYPVPAQDFQVALPYITGEKPTTLAWFWEPFREHRFFLSKIWYLTIAKATHGQDVWIVWFNSFWMLAAAFVCLWGVSKIRGRLSLLDLIFPFLVLSPTQCVDNWIFGWNCCIFIPISLLLTGGTLLLSWPQPASRGRVVAFSLCIVGLPLCGIGHLISGTCLATAAVYLAVVSWNRPRLLRSRFDAVLLLSAAATTLVLDVVYFIGLTGFFAAPPSLGVLPALLCASVLFSTSLLGSDLLPTTQEAAVAGVMLLVLCYGIFLSIRTVLVDREEARSLAVLSLIALLSAGLLIGSVAWGRNSEAGIGGMSMPRLTSFAVPALVFLLLILTRYAPRFVQGTVYLAALSLLVYVVCFTEPERCQILRQERREAVNGLQEYHLADLIRNQRCYSFFLMSDEDLDRAMKYRLGMLSRLEPLYYFDDLKLIRRYDKASWKGISLSFCNPSLIRIDPENGATCFYLESHYANIRCDGVKAPPNHRVAARVLLESSLTGRIFSLYYCTPEAIQLQKNPDGTNSCFLLITQPCIKTFEHCDTRPLKNESEMDTAKRLKALQEGGWLGITPVLPLPLDVAIHSVEIRALPNISK